MNIPKDQIEQLTLEQREALALSEFQRADKRKRLLKDAGSKQGWLSSFPSLVRSVVFVTQILALITFNTSQKVFMWIIFFITMILIELIEFHERRVNRRLDALLELMEEKHDT
jgi:hypothetical protein